MYDFLEIMRVRCITTLFFLSKFPLTIQTKVIMITIFNPFLCDCCVYICTKVLNKSVSVSVLFYSVIIEVTLDLQCTFKFNMIVVFRTKSFVMSLSNCFWERIKQLHRNRIKMSMTVLSLNMG